MKKGTIKSEKEIQLDQLKKKLARIESELNGCRGTVLEDGWQTQRYALKIRKWDVLAQEKRELREKIEDLEMEQAL